MISHRSEVRRANACAGGGRPKEKPVIDAHQRACAPSSTMQAHSGKIAARLFGIHWNGQMPRNFAPYLLPKCFTYCFPRAVAFHGVPYAPRAKLKGAR